MNEARFLNRARQLTLRFEKEFCRLGNIYIRYYRKKGDIFERAKEYEEIFTKEETAYLDDMVQPESDKLLLRKFSDNSPENVISQEYYGGIICYGAAVRLPDGRIHGVCVFYAFSKDRTSDPAYIRHADESMVLNSIYIFQSLFDSETEIEKEALVIEESLNNMKNESERNQNLIRRQGQILEILGSMKSDEDFGTIADHVMHTAGIQLGFDSINLIGRDNDGDIVKILASQDETGIGRFLEGMNISDLPFFTGRPYTVSSDSDMPQDFRKFFTEYHIKAGVFLPLSVHNSNKMYIVFLSRKEIRVSHDDLRFMSMVQEIMQSILTRKVTTNSLAGSYVTLEAILENTGCGMRVIDTEKQEILYSNKSFRNMFRDSEDLKRLELLLMAKAASSGSRTRFYAENEKKWYDVTFTDIKWVDGRTARLCTLYDITVLREYQLRVEHQANTDYLTGLMNRKKFELDIESEIKRSRLAGTVGMVLLIGLDNFSQINDTMGHDFGDELIKMTAETIVKICPDNSGIYRIDGDEFVVIVRGNERQFDSLIHRLEDRFRQVWEIDGRECYCTASIGAAFYPVDGDNGQLVFDRMDMALRSAKKSGKDQISFFDEEQKNHSDRELGLENALRSAVNNNCSEFEVYYQPLIDVKDGKNVCCGAEALVRWNSARYGLIMPSEFIPLAERTGVITDLGQYVLETALKAVRRWNDFGHPEYKVNVNLSVHQLLQSDIVSRVRSALGKTGADPNNLTLEITESLAIYDMKNISTTLHAFRDMGIRLALDDFGTGYSSLSYIKNLPLDVIKIDKSFVDELGEDDFSEVFINTVSSLADALKANVVVEGVERKEQKDALADMNVDMIQGYFYDKPLQESEFEKRYLN